MLLNRDLESVWWALRIGLGGGVKLKVAAIEREQNSSKDWQGQAARGVSRRHRYLHGHRTRATNSHSGLHRFYTTD